MTDRKLSIGFKVAGPPVPWQRVQRNRRTGRAFVPDRTRKYQKLVGFAGLKAKLEYEQATGSRWPLDAQYGLSVWAYVPDRRRRDQSNIEKTIEDALNMVLWNDDSQIIDRGVGGKRIDPAFPRVEVFVWIAT